MRLRHLSLDLFGHFTDQTYDFGAGGDGDFHLIYGPNEAGKTTTMEAALRLLYGFPAKNDGYDFKHGRQNMRLSGVLDIDGAEKSFVRVPGRNSLLDARGNVLAEQAISGHLGGLSLTDYRALLCLDDETIETGGEDIANAKGDIGRLLFSAAAGIADLSAVLTEARNEADQIYRKRASSTRMALLKKDLAEIDRQIRDNDTSATMLKKLRQTQQQAQTREDTARSERDDLHKRRAEVATLRRALPRMAERDALAAELDGTEGWPDTLDLDPNRLVQLTTDEAKAQADLIRLTDAIAQARQARDALTITPEAETLVADLKALDELHSRYVSARPDLPKRRRTRDEAQERMQRHARDLGLSGDTDPTALVCSPPQIASLEAARDEMREAAQTVQTEADELATLDDRLATALQAQRDLSAQTPVGTTLADLLLRHDADRIARAYATAMTRLRSTREARDTALVALTRGATAFDALPVAPFDPATADAIADRHATLTDQIARTTQEITDSQETAERHSVQAAQIGKRGTVSDTDATEARAARDALWQTHLETLDTATAQAFEQAMTRFDHLSETRLAHAQDVARLREIALAQAEAKTRATQAERRLDTLRAECETVEAQTANACIQAGLPHLSPSALRDWITAHTAAAEAQRQLDAAQAEQAPILARAQSLLDALRPHLPQQDPDFDAALDTARAMARDAQQDAQRRATTDATVTELTRDRDTRQARHQSAQNTKALADSAWQTLVQDLFKGHLSPDALLPSLDPLRRLREDDAQRAQAVHQIRAMEQDQAQFADEIERLAARFGVAPGDPLDRYAALQAHAREALDNAAQRDRLTDQLTRHTADKQAAQDTLDTIGHETRSLAAAFPDSAPRDTLDALRTSDATAREIIRKRQRLMELDRGLTSDLGAADLDTVRDRLADTSATALEAEEQTLTADLDRAETALTQAIGDRAAAARDLQSITGDAEIAGLVERRTTLELQLEEAALDYLQRDFGLRLAEEAIRRYRDSHRSGMMEATERAFAELTNGAYTRLVPQVNGPSEVLQVLDANGTAKQVADLSKGTRFQLYLALRAAAYEQLVSQGVVLPFFCDDIFETFDEDRTRAACRLMERIGRSGQAIYLTHHRHVVDIAQEVCTTAPKVHRI
ncbi:uncharacterized protein YhaN [Sagittula marina]|uniref:Uncharacterized protein YhaN n=1 Tax=Sagittula marina TaxID=943940 RepID=A0A7W6DM92_9RHOB|nr:YhaN family protein [Sagittula marina]MBB3985765.1 uncharacterized protein YhaN [Sagittula marina]